MIETRVRIGIAEFADGWNVVIQWPDRREVFEPTFATEAEAQAKADDLSDAVRRRLRREGIPHV